MLYREACERWIFDCSFCKEFQGFKEWLGVLRVNDVMFSYRSFFSREVLGKRWGLSTCCGASPWVECDIVSLFSETLLKQQFASSQFFIWSLHPIYHHIHCVIVSRPLLFFQRHTNGHYVGFLRQNIVWRTETILVWVREPEKHDCIVGVTMEKFNSSELQKENDFLQQFSSSLVTYLFIIILSMLSLFWGRLVIPRRSVLEFPSIQLYFMSAILA
jgi:hypothetical protein